jgi:hypothetical protein
MRTEKTQFDDDAIDRYTCSAGVIPVAHYNGATWVLLARERYSAHWRGSLRWSGFEGGRMCGESVVNTAHREWREESLSVFDIPVTVLQRREYVCRLVVHVKHDGEACGVDAVVDGRATQEPRDGGGVAAEVAEVAEVAEAEAGATITHSPVHGPTGGARGDATGDGRDTATAGDAPPRGLPRFRTTYVCEVPFDVHVGERFRRRRDFLLDMRRRIADSVHQLRALVGDDAASVQDIQVTPHGVVIETHGGARHPFSHPLPEAAAAWYREHCAITECARKGSNDWVASAIATHRGPSGRVVHWSISDAFLEKDCVQWWRVSSLRSAVKNGGRFVDRNLRVFFLPVALTIAQAEDSMRAKRACCKREASPR